MAGGGLTCSEHLRKGRTLHIVTAFADDADLCEGQVGPSPFTSTSPSTSLRGVQWSHQCPFDAKYPGQNMPFLLILLNLDFHILAFKFLFIFFRLYFKSKFLFVYSFFLFAVLKLIWP